jgi:NAD(P)-dependent dehydrogenase (short-subunit alcohol dehydrogenase family)
MGSLKGRKIVITGGSHGIGYVVAEKCVQEGAQVVIAARNKSDLEEATKNLNLISSPPHLQYALDVGALNQVRAFAAFVKSQFGEIHGLVNCAGVYGPIGKSTSVDLNAFSDAIQVNLLGTVYMCAEFASLFTTRTRKKIVNYSGGGAASPFPNYSAYAASKAAIVRLTENLSIELMEDEFDVNCVAPGFVITRLHQQTLKAGGKQAGELFYENTKKQIESGGVPPQKAAELTCFLLSRESDGISGKFISAAWDPWNTKEFQDRVRRDADFAVIRRIDDKTFFKKP